MITARRTVMQWWHELGVVLLLVGLVPLLLVHFGAFEFALPDMADDIETLCPYIVYVGCLLAAHALSGVEFVAVGVIMTLLLILYVSTREGGL